MRILVTGGAGFIGSHLVDALVARGDEVVVIDNLSSGKQEHINPTAQFFQKDIRDFNVISPFFRGVDAVFHLAALASVPLSHERPEDSYDHNVNGTLNVLQASHDAETKKVIFASSCAVYGENGSVVQREDAVVKPASPYAVHKLAGERYCDDFSKDGNAQAVALRFFNVYGSWRQNPIGGYAGVIPAFRAKKRAGKPLVIFGDGTQTRDFVHWQDVVLAMLRAAERNIPFQSPINIGSGIGTSVNEIADIFGGDRVYEEARSGDVKHVIADIAKAKQILGWAPAIELREGLAPFLNS